MAMINMAEAERVLQAAKKKALEMGVKVAYCRGRRAW